MNQPLVSIIITTKNEEKNIGNCLASISEQTYTKIEIIVVDNFSSDPTREIASRYTSKVYERGPERSAQRNFGMLEIAEGDLLMFLDADMILSPVLVDNCVQHMQDHSFAALHIPEVVLGKNYYSQVRRFERSFYDGTVIDGARFFRKEIFAEVKGFDKTMSGPEDWDIDKKIKQNGKIGLLSKNPIPGIDFENWKLKPFIIDHGTNPEQFGSVIFHNEAEFDLRKYLTKKRYYSQSFDPYIKKWGKNDPDIRKQLGLWYRFFGVFLENSKWRRLISHPHLALGIYFLRFLVGLQFLSRKRTNG